MAQSSTAPLLTHEKWDRKNQPICIGLRRSRTTSPSKLVYKLRSQSAPGKKLSCADETRWPTFNESLCGLARVSQGIQAFPNFMLSLKQLGREREARSLH